MVNVVFSDEHSYKTSFYLLPEKRSNYKSFQNQKGKKGKECIKTTKETLQSLLVIICMYVICLYYTAMNTLFMYIFF